MGIPNSDGIIMTTNRFGTETLNRSCDSSWQLTNSNDVALMDNYANEALSIGGATINVFKLLGVHEQGQMVDLAGNGIAISGGTANGNDPLFAFKTSATCSQWRSSQKGLASILMDAFIGYNFGQPKLSNGRNRYGPDVDVTQHITTIKLRHSTNPSRRAIKMRVERSNDGLLWNGVDIITTTNSTDVQTFNIKQSAPSRYWRLRPISFTGTDADFWELSDIELYDWNQTSLFNVQDDYGWTENRDREYSKTSIKIKAYYDVSDRESDLTKFGFSISEKITFTVNFNDIVNRLGRPIVIGDVFEMPNEAQYDPNMKAVKKYVEVSDVSWSADGYSPTWQPIMLKVTTEPMIAKQETMDIVGDFVGAIDSSGLFQRDNSAYTEIGSRNDVIREKASNQVPLQGLDSAEFTTYEPDEIKYYEDYGIDIGHMSVNQKMLYVEDAIPKNGEPYTEGTVFPANPKDREYHRLTYVGLAENIPARLYRYSTKKNRWVHLETDKRSEYNMQRPSVDKILASKSSIMMTKLGKGTK